MMIETTLLNYLKLKNDVDITEIKQILFATNMRKAFILKNSLKVIIRQLALQRIVPYKGRSITPKLYIFCFWNEMFLDELIAHHFY